MSKRLFALALPAALIVALLAACAGAAGTTPGVVDLEGTRWLLETMHGEPLLPGTELTLQFEDGNAGGSSGCNSFGGRYLITDGQLSLPEIEQTLILCTEPEGVMEQETEYVAALQETDTYQVVDDRLQIMNAAGETTLVFRMAE